MIQEKLSQDSLYRLILKLTIGVCGVRSEGQVLEDGPVSQRSSSGFPGDCAMNSHTNSNFHYKLSHCLKPQELVFIGAQMLLKHTGGVKHYGKSTEYKPLQRHTERHTNVLHKQPKTWLWETDTLVIKCGYLSIHIQPFILTEQYRDIKENVLMGHKLDSNPWAPQLDLLKACIVTKRPLSTSTSALLLCVPDMKLWDFSDFRQLHITKHITWLCWQESSGR